MPRNLPTSTCPQASPTWPNCKRSRSWKFCHHRHVDRRRQCINPTSSRTFIQDLQPQREAGLNTCTIASLISPLTANIYYSAILDLSHKFHVSTNPVNLTIKVYLRFQGLAPTFIGSISDATGRRPAYTIRLTIYFMANLGLALQDSYAGLRVLRYLQSAGVVGLLRWLML